MKAFIYNGHRITIDNKGSVKVGQFFQFKTLVDAVRNIDKLNNKLKR